MEWLQRIPRSVWGCVESILDNFTRSDTTEGNGIGIKWELTNNNLFIDNNQAEFVASLSGTDTKIDRARFRDRVCSLDVRLNSTTSESHTGVAFYAMWSRFLIRQRGIAAGSQGYQTFAIKQTTGNQMQIRRDDGGFTIIFDSGTGFGDFGAQSLQAVESGADVDLILISNGDSSGTVTDTTPPLDGHYVGFGHKADSDGASGELDATLNTDDFTATEI